MHILAKCVIIRYSLEKYVNNYYCYVAVMSAKDKVVLALLKIEIFESNAAFRYSILPVW